MQQLIAQKNIGIERVNRFAKFSQFFRETDLSEISEKNTKNLFFAFLSSEQMQ